MFCVSTSVADKEKYTNDTYLVGIEEIFLMSLIDRGVVLGALYLGPPSIPTALQRVANDVAIGTHFVIDGRFLVKLA